MKINSRQHFSFNDFNIYCYCYETSSSWGHNATLFNASRELATDRIRYYNRTWERYTYQSVILSVIHKAIKERECTIFDDYKYNNNKTRLSKETKETLIKDDKTIEQLKNAYNYFDKEYGR